MVDIIPISNKPILLVGPDPERNALGGVAQHIRILKSLHSLNDAVLFDPGSIQGKPSLVAAGIIMNCIRLKRNIDPQEYSQVWINSSIYPFAFLKLLIIIMVLRKTPNLKKRVFFHGGRFENIRFLKFPFLRWWVENVIKETHSFHFLSSDQGQGFELLFPKLNWHLFNNYIPKNDTLIPIKKDHTRVLLFVGRMIRSKGIFDILSSLKYLEKTYLNKIQVWFAGDGEDLPIFKKITKSQPAVKIRILGRQTPSALENIYARSFALLLPTYHQEGLPYVILEALRAGLPIIATANGTIGDIISPGKNGFLIPPKDPIRLSLAIRKLLDNSDCAIKMGELNRKLFLCSFSKSAAEIYYDKLQNIT